MTLFVNAVLDALDVSEQYSPRKTVTPRKFDFKRDCKVQFGTYIQASNDAIITNTTKLRTVGILGMLKHSLKVFFCLEIETLEYRIRINNKLTI